MNKKFTKYSKEILEPIVKSSNFLIEVIRKLGLSKSGSMYRNIDNNIKEYRIDTSHFLGHKSSLGKITNLKKVLIKERGHKCEICNLTQWQGVIIPLEIHHIKPPSNKKEDLQLLCPNCHALTPNYRKRGYKKDKEILDDDIIKHVENSDTIRQLLMNLSLTPKGGNYESIRKRLQKLGLAGKYKKILKIRKCVRCDIEFCGDRRFCSVECANKYNWSSFKLGNKFAAMHPTKIIWPIKEELEKLIWKKPTSQIAKELGVSDKAVEKWCKKYGIAKPPRGYWMKSDQVVERQTR